MMLFGLKATIAQVLVCCVLTEAITRYDSYPYSSGDKSLSVEQKWIHASKALDRILLPQAINFANILEIISTEFGDNLSLACSRTLLMIADGIRKRRLWAYQYFDSSGKGKSGILRGLIGDLGDFDQCMQIEQAAGSIKGVEGAVSGQYCLIRLVLPSLNEGQEKTNLTGTLLENTWYERVTQFSSSQTLNFGLCLPSTCLSTEVESAFKKFLVEAEIEVQISAGCDSKDDSHALKPTVILALFCIIVMVSLVFAGTYFDMKPALKETTLIKTLKHFSIYRNTCKVFSDFEDNTNKTLYFIHGSRVWFICVTIWVNFWILTGTLTPALNVGYEANSSWIMKVVNENVVGIHEIMFIISGVLVVFTWLPQMERQKSKVTFTRFIGTRWLRTVPTLAGVLLLNVLWPTLGSGPLFRAGANRVVGNCARNWWTNLLFVSNWVNPRDSCLPQAWFLSVDFQLYLLSFFALLGLNKKPRATVIAIIGVIATGLMIPGVLVFYKGLPVTIDIAKSDTEHVQDNLVAVYFATFNHIASYFSGLLLGFCLLKNYRHTNENYWTLGWLSFPCLLLLSLYVQTTDFLSESHRLWAAAYGIFSRSAVNFLFLWFAYGFANNRGGALLTLVSHRVYIPLSRMAFSVYSSQFIILWFDCLSSSDFVSLGLYSLLTRMVHLSVLCLLLGYFVYMVFEAPSVNLIKIALTKMTADPLKEKKGKNKMINNNTKLILEKKCM